MPISLEPRLLRQSRNCLFTGDTPKPHQGGEHTEVSGSERAYYVPRARPQRSLSRSLLPFHPWGLAGALTPLFTVFGAHADPHVFPQWHRKRMGDKVFCSLALSSLRAVPGTQTLPECLLSNLLYVQLRCLSCRFSLKYRRIYTPVENFSVLRLPDHTPSLTVQPQTGDIFRCPNPF